MHICDPPICLALDLTDRDAIDDLAHRTAAHVGMFKVGLTAFVAHGHDLVRELGELRPVFLDLKFHDIPTQVEGAVRAARASGARMLTIHAGGGSKMIEAAVRASEDELIVLAVTVLTSLDAKDLSDMGVAGEPSEQVRRLADVALAAGAHGLVCSPHEVADLRRRVGPGPAIVVPGIRAGGSDDDQKRTMGPEEAIALGADLLVVGRPISEAADPAASAGAFAQAARR